MNNNVIYFWAELLDSVSSSDLLITYHTPGLIGAGFNLSYLLVAGIGIIIKTIHRMSSWWRHQMETFSALLAICVGNSLVTGEFPAQRPVTRSCDVFFDLRLNKRLSKQSWGWWFETTSRPLWRHCNVGTRLAFCYVWEVFHYTWWALQMSFRGILFSWMELAPWFDGTLCVRN